MKKILGLDLGTNSIGWALIEQAADEETGRLIGAGSRIIPMSQDVLGKFDSGQSSSQTAERTRLRSARRLRERHLLRRERLHRVLHIIDFLPSHYAQQIDFNRRLGKFIPETEPKIAYRIDTPGVKPLFIFEKSFQEMMQDFTVHQPSLVAHDKKVPRDWTLYYLRKKALTQKIEKEELSWILLNFNQKRGYYQLRGEDEEKKQNKTEAFYSLRVTHVVATGDKKGTDEIWYNVHLENGWIYPRKSRVPLDWVGKTKEFIVTTELNEDGTVKTDKEGKEKRSFRSPSDEDWGLLKKKTEHTIEESHKTVGAYIYDTLLQKPDQKITGELIRVIERKFYRQELEKILEKQEEFHTELNSENLYQQCLLELYEYNENHRQNISQKGFSHLFVHDIIFYQRPLKSKKSLISDCKFERRIFLREGKKEVEPIKCIAKSHPLFQEYRLWQFIQNLRIYQREKEFDGKLQTDVNVTDEFLRTEEDWVALFDWLNDKKEIDQKTFLKYFNLKKSTDKYRWNYVEDKIYPCNETRYAILSRLEKVDHVPEGFTTRGNEELLWHMLYSVEDKEDIKKALKTFSEKNGLSSDFIEIFQKFPVFKKDYGAYSAKAIKKLLPLMRRGKYWSAENIDLQTKRRIDNILTGEYDATIRTRVREKAISLHTLQDFQNLPVWLTSYIVYDRHSEDSDATRWKTANDITFLPQHSLRNPIVEQIINETLKVVRDIWNHYGQGQENFFQEIHVELGREMKNPAAKRQQMTARIQENENTNLRIKRLLAELMADPEIDNVRPHSPMQQEILKIYEEGALQATEDLPDDILKISKQAQPTTAELTRYKLWLQQRYRSPYTGQVIPLNKLFTRAYDIEHVLPQSRHFDDSLSNKVICEVEVNQDKGNNTAYEYISNNQGRKIPLSFGRDTTLLMLHEYEHFIKTHYAKNRGKLKKLLMEDIPEDFIERQLNDSRYISRVVKGLMSNIVREDGEQEAISRNVLVCNGNITNTLKQHWGLNHVWNDIITPRFERLNALTNSKRYGDWTTKDGKKVFQIQMPIEQQRGFDKKRIDHRHHALDAIIIACTNRNHVNYLNNETALGKRSPEEKDRKRYDLRHKLCFKKYNDDTKQNYSWIFHKPWGTFTQDTRAIMENIVVSFKQNLRILKKAVNHYQTWKPNGEGQMTKMTIKQTKGELWAIRKSLHADTVSGQVRLKRKKDVSLAAALDIWEMIVDKELRKKIKDLFDLHPDKKKVKKLFIEQHPTLSKIEIYYWNEDIAASRTGLNEKFEPRWIESITDTGIQKILNRHLHVHDESNNPGGHPFSPEGLDMLNQNMLALNDGRQHKPILKVRTSEPLGNKFRVGQTGNKKDKYVEADKGTNLFFAIYMDDKKSRQYETIPLNIVIERLKQKLAPVPEVNEKDNTLLFYLSPNDLVYVPAIENNNPAKGNQPTIDPTRVYKMVSASGSQCFFIRHDVAIPAVNKLEFFSSNKMEKSIDGIMIKEKCLKLRTDRLGNVNFTS